MAARMTASRFLDGVRNRVGGLPSWARWATAPYPPGHYHSPLPVRNPRIASDPVKSPPQDLPGIDVHRAEQLALAERFATYYREMPFGEQPKPGVRYYLDCGWFAHGDGVALYGMLRHLQ